MAVLDREALFSACRAIYDMAEENYVLSPLIRKARTFDSQSKHVYDYIVETAELYFIVALDEKYRDANISLSKFPLRIQIGLRDRHSRKSSEQLGAHEKYALMRAFFLGVRAPIMAEKKSRSSTYKVSIQLASNFYLDCGEISAPANDTFSEDICNNVGREIYKRSEEFFESSQEGIVVWSTRAAQDLLGEPKPRPEFFWPLGLTRMFPSTRD